MDILEKIFGSSAKVRIMKLFLFHPNGVFTVSEVNKRIQLSSSKSQKEIRLLEKIGFLKRKAVLSNNNSDKKVKDRKKKVSGLALDKNFPYLVHLQSMLIHTNPFANKDIAKKFKNSGELKLLITSGIFIQNWESRVDLLIVGDKLKKNSLQSVIKTLEAEMGCELRYTILESGDFLYRLNIYDKLLRDVLDFPHEKILNKLDV